MDQLITLRKAGPFRSRAHGKKTIRVIYPRA